MSSAHDHHPTFKEVTDVQSAKSFAKGAISSTYFDFGIGIVIVLNAAMVSLEQEVELNGHDTIAFKVLDSMFLVIYMVELWLRFFAEGFHSCIRDNWIRCDIFLVLLGVLGAWILDPVMGNSQLGPLMVLRTLRLLRLVKTARLLRRIQVFWMLIRGLLNSCTIMVYALSIQICVLYMFACVAIELTTKHALNRGPNADSEFQDQVERYFSNLPQAMLTLIRFISMDNASEVYTPLVDKNPWLAIYFIIVMLVTHIVLMNLITAVIFVSMQEENHRENETAQKNAEDGWTELIRELKGVFTRLDPDRSGKLTAQKMAQIPEEDRLLLAHTLGIDESAKPSKVFLSMDRFKRGEITMGEFYDAIFESVMGRGEINMKRMERQFEKMYWRQKDIFDIQQEEHMYYKKLYDNVETMVDIFKGWNEDDRLSPRTRGPVSPPEKAPKGEMIQLLPVPTGKAKRPEKKVNGLHDDSLLSKASELSDIISSWETSMRLAMDSLKDLTDTMQKGVGSEHKKSTHLDRQISPLSGSSNPLERQVSPRSADSKSLAAPKKQPKSKRDEDRTVESSDLWKSHGV